MGTTICTEHLFAITFNFRLLHRIYSLFFILALLSNSTNYLGCSASVWSIRFIYLNCSAMFCEHWIVDLINWSNERMFFLFSFRFYLFFILLVAKDALTSKWKCTQNLYFISLWIAFYWPKHKKDLFKWIWPKLYLKYYLFFTIKIHLHSLAIE